MGDAVCSRDATAFVHDVEAQQRRREEENARQKAKRQIGLKLIARSLIRNVAPMPNRSTIHRANKVRQQAERNHEHHE